MIAEKVTFCRDWFAAGKCPGCWGDLRSLAGFGDRHAWDGTPTVADDPDACAYTADDLTSLVLIGSGVVAP